MTVAQFTLSLLLMSAAPVIIDTFSPNTMAARIETSTQECWVAHLETANRVQHSKLTNFYS